MSVVTVEVTVIRMVSVLHPTLDPRPHDKETVEQHSPAFLINFYISYLIINFEIPKKTNLEQVDLAIHKENFNKIRVSLQSREATYVSARLTSKGKG